jgi:phospholipid/cholesterol/gamma-HCH transport system substrate-binding protein
MRLNRRIVLNVIVFSIGFIVMTTWAVRQVVSVDQLDKPYSIAAEFPNAFGVVPNAEVTYLGVGYGTVTQVKRVPSGVRIDMKIERDKRIPVGATAMITRKSAIGEPYVDFSPPDGATGAPTAFLQAGAVIDRDHTRVPLEFSELLRSASALVAAIPPDDVHTLVHEAAVGLDGRSDSLRAMAEAGDRLSATFAARTEALDRLATNNTRLTAVVTAHRGDLGSSIASLRQVADTLRRSQGDTSLLLDRGSSFLTETADLVGTEKANLDCDLKVLTVLLDETSTPRRLQELGALLDIGPKAFDGLYDSIDVEPDGPWIRVGNISNTENPPAQYAPPKQLPPVQQVPACTSALQAARVATAASTAGTSGDYRPRTAPAGEPLPATGAAGAGTAGGLLLAAGLVTRRLRRRGPAARLSSGG